MIKTASIASPPGEFVKANLLLALLASASIAAGCIGAPEPDAVEGASATDAAGLGGRAPSTETFEGVIETSVATPLRTLNLRGAFSTTFKFESNTTGVIAEVEWTASTPASEKLSVWVRATGAGMLPPQDPTEVVMPVAPVAMQNGVSPIRIALLAEAFPEQGGYDVIVRAAAEPFGVAVNQPFTAYVTTFAEIPFNDSFSAIGAETSETA